MGPSWQTLAQHSDYEIEDFQKAAYLLTTRQVLYQFNPQQRFAYRVVKEHPEAYRQFCELMGMELQVHAERGFVLARPWHDNGAALKKDVALLLLALTRIYHDKMRQGQDEMGRVAMTLEELFQLYRHHAGQELPGGTGQLRLHLSTLQRFGVMRLIDPPAGNNQPFAVEILPAISAMVDEPMLARLETAIAQKASETQQDELETEDNDVEDS